MSCDTDSLTVEHRVSVQHRLLQAAFWCTCGAAIAILFSIAASQILMGIAIAAFLAGRGRVRLPAVAFPLGLFLLGTLLSLAASPDPKAGLPQVRKLYVYLALALVFSVVRKVTSGRNLMLSWCALGGIGSLLGIAQFAKKWQEARALHQNFYQYYTGSRITGFMSHWMTFSGEQMLVLLVLAAFLLFGRRASRPQTALWIGAAVLMAVALLFSDTRSVWLGVLAALTYLAWSRKRILALAVPIVAAIALLAAPSSFRERAISIIRPHGDRDSNSFRIVVWRTGLRMIEAHPLLGLGPEEVHARFNDWIPADIARPLPTGYYGHLHSIYVHYAAERGIPDMLMVVWMLLMILWHFGKALLRLPPGRGDTRFLLQAGIACVIGIMIEGFFELNLGDSEVLTMFLVLTACGYVAVEDTKHVIAQA